MEVLVVDDDNGIREVLCCLLSSMGSSAIAATNGSDAVAYLEKCEQEKYSYPSLIILDLNMPVMDGFEFLALRKARLWAHIPLIIMTAQEQLKEEIGFFIKKPFEIEFLLETIEQIFSKEDKMAQVQTQLH